MVKISALPPMTDPAPDDEAPVVDDSAGATKKFTLTTLKEWFQSLTSWITTAMIADEAVTSEKLTTTVAFSARRTTDQVIATTSYVKVVFATEDYDYGSDYDTTTALFTAPYDGVYHFDAAVQTDAVGTTSRVSLYKNGVSWAAFVNYANAATDDLSAVIARDMELNAGDTVGAYAYQDSGGNRSVLGSNTSSCYLDGHLVGRGA